VGRSLLRPEPEPQATVAIGGREYTFARARLGTFVLLQQAKEALEAASRAWDTGGLADALFAHVSAGMGLDRAEFEVAPWTDILTAFEAVETLNILRERESLSVIRYGSTGRPPAWDFAGRDIVVWIDLFARAYGWTRDEVLDLYPEEALALLQEIMAHDFYERRFIHSLSEVAYRVDKSGKATYVPLLPPYWMAARDKPLFQVEKSLVPLGVVKYPRGQEPKEEQIQ
jgi:hypothetical protein